MNLKHITLAAALLFGSSLSAFAGNVRTDYDHTAQFSQYRTYSWGNVSTSDPFVGQRIQQAVDAQLKATGWKLLPTGGAVTVFASDNVHNQEEIRRIYDGFGGGWGGGWGWGHWGWGMAPMPGGFMGDSVTSTEEQPIGNLVIDMFEGNSKTLLWRGLATDNLSSNPDKNTRMVNNDIRDMFKDFPPRSTSK